MNNLEVEKLNREKYNTVLQLLEEEYLLLHLDGTVEGTVLPDYLSSNPSVTLKISRLFRGDLDVTVGTIKASLLFGNAYFDCVVPMSSVWGVTTINGNNIIWPESTPPDILSSIEANPEKSFGSGKEVAPSTKKKAPSAGKQPTHLRRVK